MFLRGEIQHKNLWLLDLQTGAQRQLTNVAPDFDIRDFDISPDGRDVVLERLRSAPTWLCWIFPGDNATSAQKRRSRR